MKYWAITLAWLAILPARAQQVTDLEWLAGDWVAGADGMVTEEHWMLPRGGIMLMMNRASTAEGAVVFEFGRIAELDGRLQFIAQPNGSRPIAFPLARVAGQDVTFENPAHDFPTRIRYWREGTILRAEVSGKDGKGRIYWEFRQR